MYFHTERTQQPPAGIDSAMFKDISKKALFNVITSNADIRTKLRAGMLIAPFNDINTLLPFEPLLVQDIENGAKSITQRCSHVNDFDDIYKKNSPKLLLRVKDWLGATSAEFYWNMYNTAVMEDNFDIMINSVRILLRRECVQEDRKNSVLNRVTQLFRDPNTSHARKSDIADLFLSVPYEELRTEANEWIERHRPLRADFQTRTVNYNIYNFSQNVHSSGISASVDITLRNFSKDIINEPPYKTIDELKSFFKSNEDIQKTLERIIIDTAVFSYGFRLRDVIQHVWWRIKKQGIKESTIKDKLKRLSDNPIKNELMIQELQKEIEKFSYDTMLKRLEEELIDSKNYCSTGYVSRIVNTLAGLDENVSTSVGYCDEIYATLLQRITKGAEKDDTIMDGLMSMDKASMEKAKEYILQIKDKIADEIWEEYKTTELSKNKFETLFTEALYKAFGTILNIT